MSAVHDYITELRIVDNAAAETIRARKNALRDYARAIGGKDEHDVPIHATETEIKKWLSAMRERNLKDRSIKNYMALVSGFYIFLIRSFFKVKLIKLQDDPFRFFMAIGALSGLVSMAFHSFFDFGIDVLFVNSIIFIKSISIYY